MTPRHRRCLVLAAALFAAAASPARASEAKPPEAAVKPPEASVKAPEVEAEGAQSTGDGAKVTGRPLAPFVAVRALQLLQDRVAHGSVAAQAAQAKMLVHVADVFAAADPADWKEPRNAQAAALYLFSAGRPSVLRAVLERHPAFTPEGDRLVKGALAYAEGQDDVARKLLGTLDPKALPASLGGHLALIMATLLTDKEPARADAMLDAARLLVPGTLVEEAALRRQIFLLADAATLDKFLGLSRQYIRRYRSSVFAANFKGRFTSFAVKLALGGDVAQLAKLDPVLAEFPPTERRSIYLTLARDALVGGRAEAARYASARAAALSPDPGEAERAKLYAAAATAASAGAPAARSALDAIDAARLPPRDAELRDAATAVAASVDADLGDRGQDLAGAAPDSPTAALLDRAHRALAASDALLASDLGRSGADATPTRAGATP
ncbi:chemotaxis protein [Lichenibacterium minor]|uniref:Chemotaxis protein n=1 Tax=Lichenibacterium minor TaxID=2316528 RepID=A0A4Q2U3X2_9HYPH|nr:chemotaxis protein [Lichenibacterium minor]RYC30488.1 chemotaxis protein [Lichenibacterium minor]